MAASSLGAAHENRHSALESLFFLRFTSVNQPFILRVSRFAVGLLHGALPQAGLFRRAQDLRCLRVLTHGA
jgi:hypothetical protein